MPKRHPLETKLPEEYERHRARFLGITVERIKFLQWYLPLKRWQHRGEVPAPSDESSPKPPVKRSSGTTMFPYDDSEIGRRRAQAAIDRVAEVGRKAGLEAQQRIRELPLKEGLPVEPINVSPRDPPEKEPEQFPVWLDATESVAPNVELTADLNVGEVGMGVQPADYRAEDRSIYAEYGSQSGRERTDKVRQILIHQVFQRQWATRLVYEEFSEEEREWLAGIRQYSGLDPAKVLDGPTEIAHIQLCSVHGESYRIMAERVAKGYQFNIKYVWEDEHIVQPFTHADRPLTVRQLVRLIDGSYIQGDIFAEGGLMLGNWESALEASSPEEAVRFAWIDSAFYPGLTQYYEAVAETWVAERTVDEDDVSLR